MESTASPALRLAAIASGVAGVIHAAAAGSHAELETLPQLFAVAAVLQLGWAALAFQRESTPLALVGLGLQAAFIGTLVLSRTVGISAIEALDNGSGLSSIGLQDGAVLGLEVAAAVALVAHLITGGRLRLPGLAVPAAVVASVALAVPAMAQPHDHSSHAHDTDVAAGHGTGDHDDHDDHGDDGHGDGGHGDGADHAHDEPSDVAAPPTEQPADDLAYPASFVSWLDTAETPDQRAAAEKLLVDTTEAMRAFPDEAAVQAAGFVSIGDGATGWEHYIHVGRIADPRVLDPDDIESIVLKVNPDGTKQVASAMYLLPFGMTMADAPDIAGSLTPWHDHQNLCWEGVRVVGTTNATGSCQRGEFRPTQPMIHVWVIPHECGPFAGIEGSHGSGCAHDHGDETAGPKPDDGHADHDHDH